MYVSAHLKDSSEVLIPKPLGELLGGLAAAFKGPRHPLASDRGVSFGGGLGRSGRLGSGVKLDVLELVLHVAQVGLGGGAKRVLGGDQQFGGGEGRDEDKATVRLESEMVWRLRVLLNSLPLGRQPLPFWHFTHARPSHLSRIEELVVTPGHDALLYGLGPEAW